MDSSRRLKEKSKNNKKIRFRKWLSFSKRLRNITEYRQIKTIRKMKKMRLMSLSLMAALAMAPAFTASAQCKKAESSCCKKNTDACCKDAKQEGVYTQDYSNDPKLVKAAQKWYKKGKWRNGFKKADAHSSVNLVDFYLQYQKNPEQWKTLFDFIAKTDLLAIPGGKHPIPGSNLTISVEDSKNDPLEKRGSESHYHHIDFQYVVKGVERFGVIDHLTSKPNCKYRPDVIHYDYDKSRARFYDSTPDKFFIFFPGDWHIAKIANDTDNQDIRVIVIKVDYKD